MSPDSLRRLKAAVDAERALAEEISRLIIECRDAGATWFAISQATQLPENTLKTRSRMQPPSRATVQPPEPPLAEAIPVRVAFEREVSVTQAAERMGVSRPTIHRQARAGLLSARTDLDVPRRPELKIEVDATGMPVRLTPRP